MANFNVVASMCCEDELTLVKAEHTQAHNEGRKFRYQGLPRLLVKCVLDWVLTFSLSKCFALQDKDACLML
jgi:hypothetical protein